MIILKFLCLPDPLIGTIAIRKVAKLPDPLIGTIAIREVAKQAIIVRFNLNQNNHVI